jgi:hypothetical protein
MYNLLLSVLSRWWQPQRTSVRKSLVMGFLLLLRLLLQSLMVQGRGSSEAEQRCHHLGDP